jgi:AAA domain/Topoisomerase DNA binding C4 zinc finger/PLD-like domain
MANHNARPYLNHGIQELEEVFGNNPSTSTLHELLSELKKRERPRAIRLRRRVEEELKRRSDLDEPSTNNGGRPGNGSHEGGEGSTTGPERDPEGSDPDQGSQDDDTEPERPVSIKERRGGRIRGPGSLPDVPPKWTPEPKTDLVPTWKAEDPPLWRYECALRALVAELRKKTKIGQQIPLQDGIRIQIDGEDAAYQFRWTGDEELFEGANVKAIADGVNVDGRLVSITAQQLIVALNADLGGRIRLCTLFIDNTAMLEALANRLKEIAEKPSGFNVALAEDAVANSGKEASPATVPSEFVDGLLALQAEAVRSAAGNSVAYLWGPPGTGKTQTLSALVRHLFADGKRILIASNTNQAVDQVLRKLCDVLTRKGTIAPEEVEILEQGKIVRVGKAGEELDDYRQFVTVAGIVERRSVALKQRKQALQERETRILIATERARTIVAAYQALDQAKRDFDDVRQRLADSEAGVAATEREQGRLEALRIALSQELRDVEAAGALKRMFMRAPEKIRVDIEKNDAAIAAGAAALNWGRHRVEALRGEAARLERAVRSHEEALAGKDRAAAQAEIAAAEEPLAEIRREITEIDRELSDIEKAVLAGARVLGATATKLFLSPASFSAFDVVILDEASMLLLPALFHAAGMAKEKVVVSGDFRQLPPIMQSEQKAIQDEIGTDVFHVAGIAEAFRKRLHLKRTTMLEEQFRMAEPICRLISQPMYGGRLHTSRLGPAPERTAPEPFEVPLTIVDTSYIGPVVAKDPAGSKFNLMNALVVRNLCRYFRERGFAAKQDVGVAAPYAAQRKLLRRILNDAGLTEVVVGTVHRYQGDDKRLMVIDLTDGVGLKTAGLWLQANGPDDDGAKLFNVAISRAKDHLVFVGDLAWLDRKLPERAFLRGWLHRIQETGRVIDVRDVMGLVPVSEDLRKYGVPLSLSMEAERTGLFDERDFDQVIRLDIASAKMGIAIWSAFVTPQRVAQFGELFRQKASEGVPVRCVVRPPWNNGSIDEQLGGEAIDALERLGCVVDTRLYMHEKAIVVDDRTVWFGSLNPLSHAGNTGEMMARFEGREAALQVATFLSAKGTGRPEQQAGASYQAENPSCGCGKTRAVFCRGSYGVYWRCLARGCDWRKNGGQTGGPTGERPTTDDPCPKCGSKLVARYGPRGWFFGCTRYPKCDGSKSVRQSDGGARAQARSTEGGKRRSRS